MRTTAMAVLASFALPVVFAAFTVRALPADAALLAQPTPPGVLHAEAEEVALTAQGRVQGKWQTTFWFDSTTGNARLMQQDSAGREHIVFVRSGLTYTRQFPNDQYAFTQIAADRTALWLGAVRESKLGYRAALDEGQLKSSGEEIVDGRTAVKVQVPVAIDGADLIEAYLDKDTGLPLAEVAFRRNQAGLLQSAGRRVINYTRIEYVKPDQLPANLFAVAAPSGWRHTTTQYLTPTTARAFREFDVYWLGPTYGGLPLFGITHGEVLRPSGRLAGRLSTVAVLYAHPVGPEGSREQVSIILRPPLTATERALPSAPGGTAAEAVTVGGHQATLHSGPVEGSARLELTIGGTFITIHGGRDQVLMAAQALQKLN